jgi:hypothetical protein
MIFILDADEPVGLQLPNQWLWDIIDEFIYQVYVQTYFYIQLSLHLGGSWLGSITAEMLVVFWRKNVSHNVCHNVPNIFRC